MTIKHISKHKTAPLLKKIGLHATGLFMTICLVACSGDSNQSNTANNADSNDLKALREDVSVLKQELNKLRKDITTVNSKVDKMNVAKTRPKSKAPRVIPLKDEYALGDEKAQVMIIEYTDFQCGYCARHQRNVLPKIKSKYIDTGKIKYAIRDFPLAFHKQAADAAVAANCAGEQGKYWEMHTTLFKNPRAFSKPFFIKQANELSIDARKFGACYDNPLNKQKVQAGLAEGQKFGVTGTPKFFVGKIQGNNLVDIKVIDGAKPLSAFETAINSLL